MSKDRQFTHFDESGAPHMVDVSDKQDTAREATARAYVRMNRTTRELIEQQAIKKGDVVSIAELAGVMAAKKTADFIPLCHPLPITKVSVKGTWVDAEGGNRDTALLALDATVKTTYKTGVEMEALTACSIAALTVYDMCKAVDRGMTIEQVGLVYKSGGKSGTFERSL
jgi:cyclic pyranopterin monophosphate synthase